MSHGGGGGGKCKKSVTYYLNGPYACKLYTVTVLVEGQPFTSLNVSDFPFHLQSYLRHCHHRSCQLRHAASQHEAVVSGQWPSTTAWLSSRRRGLHSSRSLDGGEDHHHGRRNWGPRRWSGKGSLINTSLTIWPFERTKKCQTNVISFWFTKTYIGLYKNEFILF